MLNSKERSLSIKITGARTVDLRFPTSRQLDGSDAMNPDPDYSAAYVILETSQAGFEGHGITFTIGRGNELCVAAIESLLPFVIGKKLVEITSDMAA
ncbi:MAG: fuconate dehydratase, partial [Gammaproteobacteria bacterium]|nr:fuconate dehydratase [Gammaproteobacteria bacterium]